MRETRLYHKGSDQHTYERFETARLSEDDAVLKRFVFLLGAERVTPKTGRCHLYALREASDTIERELTKDFYVRYADMRRAAFDQLRLGNPDVSPSEVLRCTQKLLDRILCSVPFVKTGISCLLKQSRRHSSTKIRITLAQSGTIFVGCSVPLTKATQA